MTDEEIVDRVIAREGGYVWNPNDAGRATNYGITVTTLSTWRRRQVSPDEVRALTKAEAAQIYLSLYVRQPGFARIPDSRLRELVVDCGVLSGQRHAAEWLQKVLGVRQDGVLGPKTMAALAAMPVLYVYIGICALRMRLVGRLITRDPKQAVFAAGWMDRFAWFVENAPTHP